MSPSTLTIQAKKIVRAREQERIDKEVSLEAERLAAEARRETEREAHKTRAAKMAAAESRVRLVEVRIVTEFDGVRVIAYPEKNPSLRRQAYFAASEAARLMSLWVDQRVGAARSQALGKDAATWPRAHFVAMVRDAVRDAVHLGVARVEEYDA